MTARLMVYLSQGLGLSVPRPKGERYRGYTILLQALFLNIFILALSNNGACFFANTKNILNGVQGIGVVKRFNLYCHFNLKCKLFHVNKYSTASF
jgi:hypothetical protein